MKDLRRCRSCLLPVTHATLELDVNGVCNICNSQNVKKKIDWNSRLTELDELISSYRDKGQYDCIVPFSGGKDSTWTLYFLKKRYPGLKPLVVRFNHGFMREGVNKNCDRVFRSLGVDVVSFTPNWRVVTRLMLQAFLEKGDFCWHCHTGIFAYPMQVAVKEKVPLIIWGEPSAEYTAYYKYDEMEEVNEERFNRSTNLGITAEDMILRINADIDPRDMEAFSYPRLSDLKRIGYRSVCLGSYIPWDVKRQVEVIERELGWEGDEVENVPPEYGYEKIECWMQGVRDYIKYIKRGYSRPSHLAAIDLRNGRISRSWAEEMIKRYEGKEPKSLDLFLEYTGINRSEFYAICLSHTVSPWQFNIENISQGQETHDLRRWTRGNGLSRDEALEQIRSTLPDCEGGCNGCR